MSRLFRSERRIRSWRDGSKKAFVLCVLVMTLCFATAFGVHAYAEQIEDNSHSSNFVYDEETDTYQFVGEDSEDWENEVDYSGVEVPSDGDFSSGEGDYTFEGQEGAELEQMAATIGGTNVRTKVIEIVGDTVNEIDGGGYTIESHVQTLKVLVLSGEHKGETATVTYDLSDAWGGGNEPDPAKVGDMVVAQVDYNFLGELEGVVTQYGRQRTMIWLGILFLVLLAFFGGRRGIRSIIALLVTCAGLIFIMIPAMNRGFSPVWAAVLASIFAITVTLTIVYGFTMKTLAAAMGAVGGIVAGGIIIAIMNVTMNMTGLVDDESMYLAQSVGDGTINLRGILFAAIVISVLGGTIDVSISIASALDELGEKAENITGAEMMKSGINIGVDIMGASLNTLILSYVGGSIHLLMLFNTYNNPMVMIINDEMIACEIMRALAGGFGLLLTVPITSFVAAVLMCKGGFGKLTPDCVASYVVLKRILSKFRKKEKKVPAAVAAGNAPQTDMPENLYARVRDHMQDMDDDDFDLEDIEPEEDVAAGFDDEFDEELKKEEPDLDAMFRDDKNLDD